MTPARNKANSEGRVARFTKARLYQLGQALMDYATTPNFTKARRKGWEMSHAMRLTRWQRDGFKPSTILDIGANQGHWTEMCQEIFSPQICQLVEPQPDLCERLLRRAAERHGAWKVFPVALGSKETELNLHLTANRAASSLLAPKEGVVPDAWGTKSNERQTVRVVRLDDLLAGGELQQADLVKIDVQGFEGEVIAGGKETLAAAKRLVVEVSLDAIYEGQPLLHDVMSSLEELGFRTDDLNETCRAWPEGKLWQVDLWMRKKDEP